MLHSVTCLRRIRGVIRAGRSPASSERSEAMKSAKGLNGRTRRPAENRAEWMERRSEEEAASRRWEEEREERAAMRALLRDPWWVALKGGA